MLKLTYFSVLLLIILVSQGSVAKSQDNGRSTCLLQDPQNQCGDFCLSKIHPMIELVPETNSKLERISREQQSIQMKLVAVQSTVEAQRITMQNSLKNITTKEEFGAKLGDTKEKLMAVIFELKNQLQLLTTKMEDQRTIKKDDFEERLNVTEEQLLVSNSELKTQLKEMDTNARDQEISMQTKLDAQFLAVQKKLEDQNTAIFESFEERLNGTEGQIRMFDIKMEAQLKELQNKTETQLLALENQQSAFQKTLLETLSTIKFKTIDPRFKLIGSRYFYIENNIEKSWGEAAETCRRMGGYLAAFKNQEEIAAIKPKLYQSRYWTGIKRKDGKFISTASGKSAPFLKWLEGDPDHKDQET
ncbi:early endosome antigen 1-like [Drosophila takahashii]|uniref:early endosome antigen 1-like n=1 Tax=Drosophila takahashii TaxID=29030 RepID=UPI003899019C